MQCMKCGDLIEAGEERDFHGRVLCEDCYMEKVRGELRGGKKLVRLW